MGALLQRQEAPLLPWEHRGDITGSERMMAFSQCGKQHHRLTKARRGWTVGLLVPLTSRLPLLGAGARITPGL